MSAAWTDGLAGNWGLCGPPEDALRLPLYRYSAWQAAGSYAQLPLSCAGCEAESVVNYSAAQAASRQARSPGHWQHLRVAAASAQGPSVSLERQTMFTSWSSLDLLLVHGLLHRKSHDKM